MNTAPSAPPPGVSEAKSQLRRDAACRKTMSSRGGQSPTWRSPNFLGQFSIHFPTDRGIPTTISPQAMRSATAAGGSWRGAVADWSRDDTTFLTVCGGGEPPPYGHAGTRKQGTLSVPCQCFIRLRWLRWARWSRRGSGCRASGGTGSRRLHNRTRCCSD